MRTVEVESVRVFVGDVELQNIRGLMKFPTKRERKRQARERRARWRSFMQGLQPPRAAIHWCRDGEPIPDAIGGIYEATPDDLDHRLTAVSTYEALPPRLRAVWRRRPEFRSPRAAAADERRQRRAANRTRRRAARRKP